ncbi:MAG: hypothetical protein OXG58_07555 [Gemmatimonadetes bacterium]|nr:hypothetical protein [Gemmatimonadota bacterium]MCY3943703.1 hypothetical protein [Gemmatimonadota bacterium]
MRRIRGTAKLGRSAALLVLVALMVACESEPEWKRPAPNLSGVYDLVSFSLRDGPTYTAPEATGTFELSQDYGEDPGQATGDMTAEVIVTSLDPPIEVAYYGKYFNYNDGTWRQTGVVAEALGTYTLDFSAEVGDTTLTVSITEPAAAVSTYIWRPR